MSDMTDRKTKSVEEYEAPLPWHLGVYDAHCHPTDTVASLEKIATMKTKALTIMATRDQDQSLVAQFANALGQAKPEDPGRFLIPAFGWHPWFSHQIWDDRGTTGSPTAEGPHGKESHYRSVLTPVPDEADFLSSLPEPRPLSALLQDIRAHLEHYQTALIGEVGLDRAFRIPGTELLDEEYEKDPASTPGGREGRRLSRYRVDMNHQRSILLAQLNLAGELQRPVSVHGVAAHGTVYETLASTWRGHERSVVSRRQKKDARPNHPLSGEDEEFPSSKVSVFAVTRSTPYPPRICLHSYSGTAGTLKQYLHPSVPVDFYFSFSSLVNFSSRSDKAVEVVKSVPDDKILVESDLHAAGDAMDELIEKIVRTVCRIKGWSLDHGVTQLGANWKHFIFG
ncbi:MAG: Cut9-interacting protein scn1 [Ramalina farinacea]|uniref:Cut9-interacting protein scn1 n=1 Tax=Ramalina farinacea TaxID=258253 RepID=A0AA43TRY5_9LECA|nr:Cut9-interacting protein scn1 [Ramalina farinacea]